MRFKILLCASGKNRCKHITTARGRDCVPTLSRSSVLSCRQQYIQHKSTFPSKETQQNILIGYTLPHDQNILISQRLQLEHLAQAQANSMHELDELSHEACI